MNDSSVMSPDCRLLTADPCPLREPRAGCPPVLACPGPETDPAVDPAPVIPSPTPSEPRGFLARFGERQEFTLRIATGGKDRLAAWRLVYQEYLESGYVQEQAQPYRYSIHDALPGTATFLIERAGEPLATVTVFPDSPAGLPADEIYRPELDALRATGRRPVEIGRLTVRRDQASNRPILMNLLDALSLYARCIRRAHDLVITVNPSHARFYERSILFDRIGGQKSLSSVCGAPAVLLRLDLRLELKARRYAHSEGPPPDRPIGRHSVYPHLSATGKEAARVSRMRKHLAPLKDVFVHRHFVSLRPLIPGAAPQVQEFFRQCYPGLALAACPTRNKTTV